MQEGRDARPSSMTVAEHMRAWIDGRIVREQLRASTAAGYRQNIGTHIVPGIGARRLQDVTGAMLDRFYSDLLSTPRRGNRPLSTTTVRQVAAILRRALSDAVRTRLIPRDPAEDSDPRAAAIGRTGAVRGPLTS
jgi:integrase